MRIPPSATAVSVGMVMSRRSLDRTRQFRSARWERWRLAGRAGAALSRPAWPEPLPAAGAWTGPSLGPANAEPAAAGGRGPGGCGAVAMFLLRDRTVL